MIKGCCSIKHTYNIAAWKKALSEPTKLAIISNPSNPVGCMLTKDEFTELVKSTPKNTVLLIDEAYYEYALDYDYPDSIKILSELKRNYFVLRTFSKAYGLAGLRVGYGIASCNKMIEFLDRVRTPYNVNTMAQMAAITALSDQRYLKESIDYTNAERNRLVSILEDSGVEIAPSRANFLFINCHSSARICAQKLLDYGVIAKAWSEPGFNNFLRVSIGTEEENDLFLKVFLKQYLSNDSI